MAIRVPLTASLLMLACAGPATAASGPILIGRSLEGRDITAVRVGDPNSARKALIVGNTHGDEPYSWLVAKALKHRPGIHGVDLWIIDTINPDGLRRGTRKNARGVDPNRNFPHRWRRVLPPGARFYQGPRPLSEPETQAVARFLQRLRPVVSIWYHQPYRNVSVPRDRPAAPLRYARIAHWPVARVRGPDYRGLIDEWQRHVVPGSDAFVVEFGADRPSPAEVQRHVRAALALVEGPAAKPAPRRAPPRPRARSRRRRCSTAWARAPRRSPSSLLRPEQLTSRRCPEGGLGPSAGHAHNRLLFGPEEGHKRNRLLSPTRCYAGVGGRSWRDVSTRHEKCIPQMYFACHDEDRPGGAAPRLPLDVPV